ncbi:oxidoreductase [Fragilaria crotonensis]|nr:oxidoreductase [Fragilaria crotonensis]
MKVAAPILVVLAAVLDIAGAFSAVSPSIRPAYQGQLLKSGGDEAAFIRSFCNAEECPPSLVDLKIPSDFPIGTYFRNGAGRYVANDGTKVMHMFDGDGLMNALTVNGDGNVVFRNKFVQTREFKADMENGGFSARGVFGTPKSGGILNNAFDMKTKNVANTNVVLCGDTLLALWEGGSPHELNPKTLETVRMRTDVDSFSAHPRYDPAKRVWVNHGVDDPDPISKTSRIRLYEMDHADGNILSKPVSITVPGVALMHDTALTENYVVMCWNHCNLDSMGGLRALFGIGSFAEALALDEDGKHVILCIPRTLFESGAENVDVFQDERIKRIEAPFGFSFHFGNAYENDQGHLIFDRVETDDRSFDFGASMIRAGKGKPIWEVVPWDAMESYKLVRYELDLENERILHRRELRSTGSMEFPTIPQNLSTRPHKFLYTVASHNPTSTQYGYPGAFCKLDSRSGDILSTFISEPYESVGEPCVVPKIGGLDEDDAYLLAFVNNGRDLTTDVVILDAKTLNEVSRATLPTFVPNGGLHGRYVEGATYDFNLRL